MATQKYDGAQALIKTLDDLGIEYIFGYSGGAAIPIFDALETINRWLCPRYRKTCSSISDLWPWCRKHSDRPHDGHDGFRSYDRDLWPTGYLDAGKGRFPRGRYLWHHDSRS